MSNASAQSESSAVFERAVRDAAATFESLKTLTSALENAAKLVSDSLQQDHKVLACGNGGSAADVADFTTEFACRFIGDRRP